MKLATFNLKDEFIKHFKKHMELFGATYENLRAFLLYKNSFKNALLIPITDQIDTLCSEDKAETQYNLCEQFLEKQQKSDLEEELSDKILIQSYQERLGNLESQLSSLREQQRAFKEKISALWQNMNSALSDLHDVNSILTENKAELAIKKISSKNLTKAHRAGTISQSMSTSLVEHIKKMQCDEGISLLINELEKQLQHLKETTGVDLAQRKAARDLRQHHRENLKPTENKFLQIENLLAPENFKALQEQIQKAHDELDSLKKKITEDTELNCYPLFLDYVEKELDTAKIQHSPEHIALARIIPKMHHYHLLEKTNDNLRKKFEKMDGDQKAFLNKYRDELNKTTQAVHTLGTYKKASLITTITATGLATLGACTLLFSPLLIIVSSSFALLAAASATVGVIIHLAQKHKEKLISKNKQQTNTMEQLFRTPLHDLNLNISKTEEEMERRLHSAEAITLASSTLIADMQTPLLLASDEIPINHGEALSDNDSDTESLCSNATIPARLSFFSTPSTQRLSIPFPLSREDYPLGNAFQNYP